MLEPYEGKLSCTVLRGEGGSNALDLPDIQKQGDFFVESPIILLAAIILVFEDLSERQVLHVPSCHRISEPPIRADISDTDLLSGTGELPQSVYGCMARRNAQDQLQGQIASAKIPLIKNDFSGSFTG